MHDNRFFVIFFKHYFEHNVLLLKRQIFSQCKLHTMKVVFCHYFFHDKNQISWNLMIGHFRYAYEHGKIEFNFILILPYCICVYKTVWIIIAIIWTNCMNRWWYSSFTSKQTSMARSCSWQWKISSYRVWSSF